jgi:hypothetical protein
MKRRNASGRFTNYGFIHYKDDDDDDDYEYDDLNLICHKHCK